MKLYAHLPSLLGTLLLSACSINSDEMLPAGVQSLAGQTPAKIDAALDLPVFHPARFDSPAGVDPFNARNLLLAYQKEWRSAASKGGVLADELGRKKETLEEFPLESMSMVGSMTRGGHRVAVVRLDAALHLVRPGNYLGQNYGRVSRIDERALTLRELVQDEHGTWAERTVDLSLQEVLK